MVAGLSGRAGADVTSHAVVEQNRGHVHVTIQYRRTVESTV